MREHLARLVRKLSPWMTKEAVEEMNLDESTNWCQLIMELEKLSDLCNKCKNHVPHLVKEFCIGKPRYGVSPIYAHFLFHYYNYNMHLARGKLNEDEIILRGIETSHQYLYRYRYALKNAKEFFSRSPIPMPHVKQYINNLYKAIEAVKDEIGHFVYQRNNVLRNFQNLPDGFIPMLELHYVTVDRVVAFVEQHLTIFPADYEHKKIKLITGKGNSSLGQIPAIRKKILEHYGSRIRWEHANTGILYLTIQTQPATTLGAS